MINRLAHKALECAYKRNKLKRNDSIATQMYFQSLAMAEEVQEFAYAMERVSEHIPAYTEIQEEAADIIISTLTYLALTGVDVEKLIEDKMNFNERR